MDGCREEEKSVQGHKFFVQLITEAAFLLIRHEV